MLILGIESSCDETAVALVEGGRRVHASVIASQTAVHEPFGGVVPEVAAREHLRLIDPLVQQALRDAGMPRGAIDAVAVTQGPGLIGALLVGVSYAKGLALGLNKPLIPVDHVHAHVHGALLGVEADPATFYPALSLVVSGGHTNLYRMHGPTHFRLLAASKDDACGESFDKVAKLLGLGYPGGPAIERLARNGDAARVAMPRMVEQKNRMEFSYSGLKTAVANLVHQRHRALGQSLVPASAAAPAASAAPWRLEDLCASFQEEALGQIVRKLMVALQSFPDTRSILVAGGVAANQRFRLLLGAATKVSAYFPAPAYCSDNAAMIAAFAYHLHRDPTCQEAPAGHDWDAYSRYDYARAMHAP